MQVSEAFICKLVPSGLPNSCGYSCPNESAKLFFRGGGILQLFFKLKVE